MGSAKVIRVALVGAHGKMGKAIATAISLSSDYMLSHAIVRSNDGMCTTCGEAEHIADSCFMYESIDTDVVVDFSSAAMSMQIAAYCAEHGLALLIGTTGFNNTQMLQLRQYSRHIPIICAANTNLTTNLLYYLVEQVAAKLSNFDAEIVEIHHRFKKDAPSGTALQLASIIATARGCLDAPIITNRSNTMRTNGDIGIASVRGGADLSAHAVNFFGDHETMTLDVRIHDRSSYTGGVLMAAQFLYDRDVGWFTMRDVLSI
jgi:4-hydroxy-tetrahydrodipicolinate reductase